MARRLGQKWLKRRTSAGLSFFSFDATCLGNFCPLALDQALFPALEYNSAMSSHRFIRKLAAGAATLGILFAQFMVAAYACPVVANDIQAQDTADIAMPCHQQKSAPDGLCEVHCQDGHKNVPTASTSMTADFVPVFIVRLPAPQPAAQIADAVGIDETSSHHSPPILLRNACFRI